MMKYIHESNQKLFTNIFQHISLINHKILHFMINKTHTKSILFIKNETPAAKNFFSI